MKRITIFLGLSCLFFFSACQQQATSRQEVSYEQLDSLLDDRFNFIVANDLGRNGYYDQKPIAEAYIAMESTNIQNVFSI